MAGHLPCETYFELKPIIRMFKIIAFCCLAAIPCSAFSQEIISRDTVPFSFWGGTFWKYSSAVEQITDPLENQLIAVRKYYPNSLVSEEYLRVNDTAWLYQQYDSLEPARLLCRGVYVSDPEYEVMDTIITFDPETYEESIQLRYSRYAFKSGPWTEQDRNGYVWTGTYEDDLREGLWQKRDAYDFTELRGYLYEGGELLRDSVLNWALSADTATVAGLLTEGVTPGQRGGLVSENTPGGLWRLCAISPDVFGRGKVWQLTHLDFLPAQCSNESWGSYLFLADRTLLFGVPGQSGLVRDEGRWELLEGNKILLSLKKRGDFRFEMKFLRDGEMTLLELPY